MFLLFEKRSAENLARLGGAGPAEEPDGTAIRRPLLFEERSDENYQPLVSKLTR